jgi:hypothetical protein
MAEEKGVIRTISKLHLQKAEKVTWNTTKGSADVSAGRDMKVYGKNGVKLKNNKPVENKATAEVESIKLLTPLEKGYDWKGKSVLKDGMIIDKTYLFEVVKFKDNIVPTDYNQIKWAYRYEGENGIIEADFQQDGISAKGRMISVCLKNDLDICGRGLTIYAYIQSKKSGGVLNEWVHYRFRFFSRETVKSEIEVRISNPELINQSSTSLCGMVCVFYFLAKYAKEDYRKVSLKLHQTGIAKYNDYTIKPDEELYKMNPDSDLKYPGFRKYNNGNPIVPPRLMPLIDWVTMASTRNTESFLGYTGKDGQDFSAINYPSILKKLMKDFLKYEDVIDYTDFGINPGGGEMLQYLIDMQKAYQEGYKIAILIDSDMLYDKPTYFANFDRWHWIIYEGDIYIDESAQTYNFSYVCWGEKKLKRAFKRFNFNSNFYGYIKGK